MHIQISPWRPKSDFQKLLSIQPPKQRLVFQGHLVSPDSQTEAPMARFSSSLHTHYWKTGLCWQHTRSKRATYYLIQQSCLGSTMRSDSGSWCLCAPMSKRSFRIHISFEFLFWNGFFFLLRKETSGFCALISVPLPFVIFCEYLGSNSRGTFPPQISSTLFFHLDEPFHET